MFNKAILMGRLTAAPEMRQTQTGKTVALFTLAVNRRFAKEGQQKADFIRCIAWEKTAEFIQRYFTKGSMLAVVGEIQTRTYDDQSGKKNYVTEILVAEAHFTGEKSKNEYSQPFPDYGGGQQNNNGAGGGYGFDEFTAYNEDDCPF